MGPNLASLTSGAPEERAPESPKFSLSRGPKGRAGFKTRRFFFEGFRVWFRVEILASHPWPQNKESKGAEMGYSGVSAASCRCHRDLGLNRVVVVKAFPTDVSLGLANWSALQRDLNPKP